MTESELTNLERDSGRTSHLLQAHSPYALAAGTRDQGGTYHR